MLNLQDMISVFPSEVIENGRFCFTAVGEKNPRDIITYAPIGANDIDKTFKDALSSRHLQYANCIGLKVGNGISAIDIDDCMNEQGEMVPHAWDIIESVKSYTEASPSGKGVRILFRSKTKFDRKKWMIKNPKLKIEYYDADDQEANGGRMVRLSGNVIRDYGLKFVDTEDLLNKYLPRTIFDSASAVDEEINPYKIKFISAVTRRDPVYVTLYGRAFHGQSESEWDIILISNLYRLTFNKNEVRKIFESTHYYNTKDKRHVDKWNNGYYANYVLDKARIDAEDVHKSKHYADLFDLFTPNEIEDWRKYRKEIIALCKELSFIGRSIEPSIKSKSHKVSGQTLVDLLYFIAINRNYIENMIIKG